MSDVQGIIFKEIHVPIRYDPEALVRSCLRYGTEDLLVGQILVYRNMDGHGLLDTLENIRKEQAIAKPMDAKQDNKLGEYERKIIALESRVRKLVQTFDAYLSTRRHFVDIHKRNVKKREISTAIRHRNVAAHVGDALGDAVVYI